MRSRRGVWIAVAIAIAFVACEPEDAPDPIYLESYEETDENGLPLGWERTSGGPENAAYVETIHPGEHGIRLSGEVTVRGPGGEMRELPAEPDLLLHLSARCDLDSGLRVDVVLLDELGGLHTASAMPNPPDEWEMVDTLMIEIDDGTTLNIVGVSAIGIAKTGIGDCEISELIIDDRVYQPGC
jgi:hypothetical protein